MKDRERLKTRMKVLCRVVPAWEVGANTAQVIPGSHYPGDYPGQVIAVKPLHHRFTPGDLSGGRAVVEIDLTDRQVTELRSRRRKIGLAGSAHITFDDRWGALAAGLRGRFGLDVERLEEEVKAEAEAAPGGAFLRENAFILAVRELEAALPPMVTHSGAGLYEVGPGKTYSTIQAALDQLWTDQGASAFTAEQEIRIFTDTYNEQVCLGAFNPRARYKLLIKAASGNSPVLDCAGVDHGLYSATGVHGIVIDGLKITGTSNASYPIDLEPSHDLQFKNCVIDCDGSNHYQINKQSAGLSFENCELDGSGGATIIMSYFGQRVRYLNCKIHDYASAVVKGGIGHHRFEGCTIWDCNSLLVGVASSYHGPLVVLNCTFYNITTLILDYNQIRIARDWIVMLNNVFHTVGIMWYEYDDSDKFDQGYTQIDRNCYYNVTKWYDSVAESDITTFAGWQARGYDANGMEADPLMTAPASDDFSLQTGSPCIRASPPAGVVRDVNHDLYATDRTDIGAVSSGTSSVPPEISDVSVASNVYTVTVTTGGAPNVRVRLMARSGTEEDEDQRLGAGNVALTGTSTGDHILVAWGCDATGHPIGEPSAPFIVPVPSAIGSGGSMLRRTPHLVTLKRPAISRDADSNVATRNYDNPTRTASVRCIFQSRGGEVSIGDEGNIVPFDSMLYTLEKDIEVNDRIEVALPFYTGNFLVTAVVPKGRIRGGYSHNEVFLQKDGVR